jgi:DNA polymerase III epsilon subunit-like protein
MGTGNGGSASKAAKAAKPAKPKAITSTPTDLSSAEYIFSLLRSTGELNETSDRLSGGWGDLISDSQGASSARSSSESADVPRTSQPAPLSASRSSVEPSLVVVFDVETTGLAHGDDYEKCRIVQMSCTLCERSSLDQVGECVTVIVEPVDFEVPPDCVHGLTHEMCLREGVRFPAAAAAVGSLFLQAEAVVAHNVAFDLGAFKGELARSGLTHLLAHVERMTPICSMKNTTALCKLPARGKGGPFKYPTLAELYAFATGRVMRDPHDAEFDVLNLLAALISYPLEASKPSKLPQTF